MGYIYNIPGTFQEFVFLIFTCESGGKNKTKLEIKHFNYKSNDSFINKDTHWIIFKVYKFENKFSTKGKWLIGRILYNLNLYEEHGIPLL